MGSLSSTTNPPLDGHFPGLGSNDFTWQEVGIKVECVLFTMSTVDKEGTRAATSATASNLLPGSSPEWLKSDPSLSWGFLAGAWSRSEQRRVKGSLEDLHIPNSP